jgi:hypothetical protein
MVILAFLGIEDPERAAAVIAVLVAAVTTLATSPIRYLFDKLLHRAKANTDYEYEERKQLRAKIGTYHGRLLEASVSLNYRLNQIYDKRAKGWLNVQQDYAQRWPRHQFFNSTIYRFMAFAAVANRFEREAIYIDSRIADKTDRLFLYYVKALRWTLTDVALFDGLGYSEDRPVDHFYTDHFRRMCSSLTRADDTEGPDPLVDLKALEDLLETEHDLEEVLRFFDGLDPDDPARLRWDRLVAFQLVLMAFIETFGYEIHKTDQPWFDGIAKRMRRETATNLLDWLPKLGLERRRGLRRRLDPGARRLVAALTPLELPNHVNRLRAQAQRIAGGAEPQV